jgi:hypothetical protein
MKNIFDTIRNYLFCNHAWMTIKDFTTESKMEQMIRLTDRTVTPTNEYQLDALTSKKHILIAECECCGKIKKFSTLF